MKFTSERERILEPLQAVIGVVERRQTMPILANVLLSAKNGRLAITARLAMRTRLPWVSSMAESRRRNSFSPPFGSEASPSAAARPVASSRKSRLSR